MTLHSLQKGQGRLIVSIPHAGTFIPDEILAGLTPAGRAVVDTDWHVDTLYDFAASLGATILAARVSRTVVDLNRSPAGEQLYPGQAETGICPTETFAGEPLYAVPPGPAEISARVERYWRPYHEALQGQFARIRALHGSVRLLDAHSIRSTIPRLFAGTLPSLNYGTNGGLSADPALVARAMAATAQSGFSQVLDGRFRGGFITRHYGNPAGNVHAIQLELAQSSYMDEDAPRPALDRVRAASLVTALQQLVEELLRE